LRPRSSNITQTKEKERRKRKSDQEERRRREQSNGAFLVLIMDTLEIVFDQKNCWTEEIHLAVTFSKIRLDINFVYDEISLS